MERVGNDGGDVAGWGNVVGQTARSKLLRETFVVLEKSGVKGKKTKGRFRKKTNRVIQPWGSIKVSTR
jgi:hypothetical protein